jgi:hypothetical protein
MVEECVDADGVIVQVVKESSSRDSEAVGP